uniref:Uncharacterized protein n=1 Tax=Oryza punctata TaxID=4537 RepID=A0A0E0LLL3_ORYPU
MGNGRRRQATRQRRSSARRLGRFHHPDDWRRRLYPSAPTSAFHPCIQATRPAGLQRSPIAAAAVARSCSPCSTPPHLRRAASGPAMEHLRGRSFH